MLWGDRAMSNLHPLSDPYSFKVIERSPTGKPKTILINCVDPSHDLEVIGVSKCSAILKSLELSEVTSNE